MRHKRQRSYNRRVTNAQGASSVQFAFVAHKSFVQAHVPAAAIHLFVFRRSAHGHGHGQGTLRLLLLLLLVMLLLLLMLLSTNLKSATHRNFSAHL